MFKAKFTILMPVSDFSTQTIVSIASVMTQTEKEFQLILLSTVSDNSVLKSHFCDDRLEVISNNPETSLAKQYNQGLAKANSELICYMFPGQIWQRDYLKSLYQTFLQNCLKIVIASRKISASAENEFFPCQLSAICHKKQAVLELGGFDEKLPLFEDMELLMRLSQFYPKGFLQVESNHISGQPMMKNVYSNDRKYAQQYIHNKFKRDPRRVSAMVV